MMQAIFDMFDERVQEIDLYFEALKELDQGNTEHLGISHYFDSEFIKILKANTLLMVYNLVESTVMGGILEIYDKLKQEGLTYSGVRKEIKDIWFAYKFRQVYDQQAHYNSYRDKAIEGGLTNEEIYHNSVIPGRRTLFLRKKSRDARFGVPQNDMEHEP